MNTAFDSISIKIASPDVIKDEAKKTSCKRRNPSQDPDEPFICAEKGTCNCGEVKKAETINYRSYRPEPDGLFCEAIFGPQKDWECSCGKYKRIKHKGLICDRCGVEITQQRVRRERLGYIQLAAAVSHIWYFKGLPSRIGTFCELSSRDVERVLYFEGFIVIEVTDPDCPLVPGQVLAELEYGEHLDKFGKGFRAGTGAEALQEVLSRIDLDAEIQNLTEELEQTTSQQKRLKTAKQLKQIADFAAAKQRPEWMILDVIPVIPPDLRPLVPLEGGRFATSDLNDLYRRVINRNNRLRKLILLRSPEVILRNEKRMLQEAVDAFFDNGRHGKRVSGPGNRPLKSLADVLKGKIGRFRQNLLGKRVDYSGRSVIVVGPELGLHQCGIPKRMAVELFKPFIIERLQAYGYTQTIKRAKHLAEDLSPESPVWDVVEEVIADHPVLLNRPPTLHRLGIQAFLPVLVEGKSIRIPPLVCKAFNADFDGDQMAVHVPLTVESQAEAKMLMLSSHNILKPSHGEPVAVPELDMVLGPSFLTKVLPEHDSDAVLLHEAYASGDPAAFAGLREKAWYHRRYARPEEAIAAHVAGQLKLHDSLQLFFANPEDGEKTGEPILTTVGRVIFNEVLPSGQKDENGVVIPGLKWKDEHSEQELPFFNAEAGGRQLSGLIQECFDKLGTRTTTEVLENVQKLAFEYATVSGISPGIQDYITPEDRDDLVEQAQREIDTLLQDVSATESEEQENEQIRIWLDALEQVENTMFSTLPGLETPLVERCDLRKVHPYVDPNGAEVAEKQVEGFSPVHIMADSGARARKNPFMQISAVIGLKAKQSGEILIPPIISSYREGLEVLDYFNSTYGSRKGLVDTAMKTAASGYLTRKLVDVAQDVRITMDDCGTLNSIRKFTTDGGSLDFKISGRTAAADICHPKTGEVLVPTGTVISPLMAEQIEAFGKQTLVEDEEKGVVTVRSVLTCETEDGVCAKCYGADLTTNHLVNVGEAVGIIAAQSIGEPGTQLTMRTFHTGGAVEDVSEARKRRILSKADGKVYFRDFVEGQTVEKEGNLWIATENRSNLDGPAYKVQQVNHPDCQLRVGEWLSEKQWKENTERYPGFDTKTWLYEVTAVLDSGCDLKPGDRLSQTEYTKAMHEYGLQRFVTQKYQVRDVLYPIPHVKLGDTLTLKEIADLREKISQSFEIELLYVDPETGKPVDVEKITSLSEEALSDPAKEAVESTNRDSKIKSVYRIVELDEKLRAHLPFKVGDEVEREAVAPLLKPFEVDGVDKPTYVVHTAVGDFNVGDKLNAREYQEAHARYQSLNQAFTVERQENERHYVTAVYHPECPFQVDEELEDSALERFHKRFMGFDADRLRHRITEVHYPDFPLEPGDLISDSEAKDLHDRYPGFVTSESKSKGGSFEAERHYRVTSVNHPDCPLKVDELVTQKESSGHRKHYKAFDTVRYYELTQSVQAVPQELIVASNVVGHDTVTQIDADGIAELQAGTRLTEAGYRAIRKADEALPGKVKDVYAVIAVHHPGLRLEASIEAEAAAAEQPDAAADVEIHDAVSAVTEVEQVPADTAEYTVIPVELSKAMYQKYNRDFKGFDYEIVFAITEDKRDVEDRLDPGTILPSKEYKALDKANLRVTHTVTEIHHPNFPYAVDAELSNAEYEDAAATYRGFDTDELALQIRIEVEEADGTRVAHVIPTGYSFSLTEGTKVVQGDTLAELHERTANLDIVAGIPRVTELFEARRPKRGEAAEIAEIEGWVRTVGTKAGIPTYRIEDGQYQSRLYQIPDEKRQVNADDWVNAGEALTDGYLNPHDILKIGRTTIEGVPVEGEEAVWAYLVDEVQKVYGKGTINDKHVETIVRQMLTKIKITDPGDSNFYPNDEVQRKEFKRVNTALLSGAQTPATGEPVLQGISKASLSTDSFISAASFQQTTKVLTDAAVSGQKDRLFGLKENVILGRLIPAGSGFSKFLNLEVSSVDTEISETGEDDD